MLIALIGCGAAKRPGACAAIELYTGNLFVAHRRYAESRGARIWILSAKYGLTPADRIIANYDETLAGAAVATRRAWDERVLEQIRGTFASGMRALILAGKDYRGWCDQPHPLELEDPIGSVGIGRRLQLLKELTP